MNPFDPLNAPLHPVNVIEASAGTGKTWNIAALFVRLVLLEQLDVAQILVVTFTKAATAELKTRLRARLEQAASFLREMPDHDNGIAVLRQRCAEAGEDGFLLPLLERALAQESRDRLLLRLKAASGGFDRAAVYTIHGFCQRVLQDFAFWCGAPFDVELDEAGGRARLLTAAQDFWRTRVAHEPMLAELAHRHRLTPQTQLAQLQKFIAKPYLQPDCPPQAAARYAAARQTWAQAWQAADIAAAEQAFWRLFPVLNKQSFRQPALESKFAALHAFKSKNYPPDAAALLSLLCNSSGKILFDEEFLASKTNKGKMPEPSALAGAATLGALARAAENVQAAERDALAALDADLLAHLRSAAAEAKRHTPQRVFDDLLADVAAALEDGAPHAVELAAALSQTWRVVLIDEFQDTDPLQYALFRKAFSPHGVPLFLVGDPKQAIYAFRGADVFAYLNAVADSAAHYGLDTNFRSHRRLVDAVNALFARPQPFALPQIRYQNVQAAREHARLQDGGAPLVLRWLNRAGEKENADTLEKRAAAWCADEIAALLSPSAPCRLDGRPLRAGEIAVLVRRRKDGALVQRELKKRGLQSVLSSRNDVFAEPEAEALAALLGYFLQPQQTGLLRFVLAGCLFNRDAAFLDALNRDEAALLEWADSAAAAAEQWCEDGVYAALLAFWARHGVETGLLAQRAERTLTNLHQLAELLAAEDENGCRPAALQQWLERQIQAARAGSPERGDEYVLRLESDDNLVKIVTVHTSKGLQYPVVFCPFAWRAGGRRQDGWQVVHDGAGAAALLHRSLMHAEHAERAAEENLSEELRLLYVALTRAQERVSLYLGAYRDGGKSAPAYLLGAEEAAAREPDYRDIWRQWAARQPQLCAWHDRAPPLQAAAVADETAAPKFAALRHTPRRFRFVRHTSFTGLLRQHGRALEREGKLPPPPAHDATPAAPSDENGIAAFPQGTAAGLCLHEILERYPFERAPESWDGAAEILTKHGFEAARWRDAVTEMLARLRDVPLLADTTLANAAVRVSEMDFLLHVEDFKLAEVRAWLLRAAGLSETVRQAAAGLRFQDVQGYLGGFIDVLCANARGEVVLADYKSNYLGAAAADYTQAAMDAAVAEHHYYLQAWIYAVAAARYLKFCGRLPEKLAVRYLFVRGADGSGNGVWKWEIDTADLAGWL